MANIITKSFNPDRWLKDGRSDLCDHVAEDQTVAYMVWCEDDTFGPVGRYVCCKPCYEESLNEESFDPCHDCKEFKSNREMRQWRWYDFYAPQGDEPYYICAECWDEEPHQVRMRKDKEAYEDEQQYWEMRGNGWG